MFDKNDKEIIVAAVLETTDIEAVTDKIAVFVLERSSGGLVAVKIITRDKAMQWLNDHVEEYPPTTFRVVLTCIAPMVELIGVSDRRKLQAEFSAPPSLIPNKFVN